MKPRFERFTWLIAVSTILVFSFVEGAAAQSPRPAISPWLSLFQNNRGNPLDSYHTFVAPQILAQQEFSQQQTQNRDLQRQIDKVLNPPKARPTGGGTGAGYRQYLHYYNGLPQGGPPYHGKR